ncbi:MAG TPA: hypothetical protein VGX92_07820 [Pyrinomonadaceae bacterium]|jgi:ADP-ribose pyrophosphatase YjhB (NUDIX family)|nr:hypothetical protein [Pyrinomonadaceae bacterium]
MPLAYTLAVRNNNGWEVLLAQKNVIDFRRTLPFDNRTLYLCEHPGEFVIPGKAISEREGLEYAAVRAFCEEVQIEMPSYATIQQFYNIGDEARFWLLWAEDNPWMSLSDDQALKRKNRYFMERDASVSVDTETERLTSSWPADRYGDLHMLVWVPINNALDYFNPYNRLSVWQEGQYALAQQAMPAYDNYRLIKVYNNDRMFPHWSERALQHMVQNPLVTYIQIYKKSDRRHPVLIGGSGQIIYSEGRAYLKAEKSTAIVEPVLGASYFVVAHNGPELVLHHTMIYVGKGYGAHKFSSEIRASELIGPGDEPPSGTLLDNSSDL